MNPVFSFNAFVCGVCFYNAVDSFSEGRRKKAMVSGILGLLNLVMWVLGMLQVIGIDLFQVAP